MDNLKNGCNDKNNSPQISPRNIDIEPEIEKNSQTLSNNEQPKEIIIGKDITIEKAIEIFPKTDESFNKIRITDVGLYSITKKMRLFL